MSNQLPSKCPHCGKDFKTKELIFNQHSMNDDTAFEVGNAIPRVGKCVFCSEFIFFQYRSAENFEKILEHTYPSNTFHNLPDEMNQISSEFVKIYQQIINAKSHGYNYLIGPGLHKAIEQLVTDYLIGIQNEKKEAVLKLSTYGRINLLSSDIYLTATAHIIRVFGNEETHFEKQYNINVEDAINCIGALCTLMTSRYIALKAEKQWNAIDKQGKK